MSTIKNGWLDQYGGPFEQQQFGTAGVQWAENTHCNRETCVAFCCCCCWWCIL